MADLLTAYFERDLSVDEESALIAQVTASPSDAERMAALAAEDYSRLGLPLPSLAAPRRLPWKLLAILFSCGALAAGALRFWGGDGAESRPDLSAGSEAFESERSLDAGGLSKIRDTQPRLEVSADAHSSHHFKLSLLNGRAEGDARAFDANGRDLGALKPLGAGRWGWDGADSQGKALSPGRYQLRISSRGKTLMKWVEIEAR